MQMVSRGRLLTVLVPVLLVGGAPVASAKVIVNIQDGVSSGQQGDTGNFTSVYETEGTASPKFQILRNGAVVATANDQEFNGTDFDIQPGDVVRLMDRTTGALIGDVPYDGRPSLSATTCTGSNAFAGLRSGGATVGNVTAYTYKDVTYPAGRYGGGGTYKQQTGIIDGDVASVSGEAFSGTFDRAIPAGYILSASQSRNVTPTIRLFTLVERFTAGCPPVVAPPAPAPAPPVARVRPRKLSASTTPKRDRKSPYTFRTKGKLSLPDGISKAQGCTPVSRVTVTFKHGSKTVSSRRVKLKSDCTYSSKVTLKNSKSLGNGGLTVKARFAGNAVLLSRSAKTQAVRLG